MTRPWKSWGKAAGIMFVFSIAFMVVASHRAAALIPLPDGGGYNTASAYNPIPSSGMFNGNSLITPYLVVGNNQQGGSATYQQPQVQTQLLVKKGTSMTLNVGNAGPDCHSVTYQGLTGPDYSSNSTGGPITFVQIYNQKGQNLISSTTLSSRQCIDANISINTNLADDYSNGSANSYYNGSLTILIAVYSRPQSAQPGSVYAIQGENSFRLAATSGGLVAFGQGTQAGYGYRDENLADGNTWTAQIGFSVAQSCLPSPMTIKPGTVAYADADGNNTTWNPNLTFWLQRIKFTDTGTSWQNYGSNGQWGGPGPAVTNYTLRNVNPQTGRIGPTNYDPQYRYRVLIMNAGVKNTVFISLSNNLDQASTSSYVHLTPSDCTPAPVARCAATPNPATINRGGSSAISVTGSVTSGQWPSTYYLERTGPSYRAIPSPAQPGTSSGTDTVSPSTSTTYTYVVYDSTTGGQAANSTKCTAIVIVNGTGPPPSGPSGNINVTCAQTVISGINVPATYAKTIAYKPSGTITTASYKANLAARVIDPGGGGPGPVTRTTVISKVPVAIVVTDTSNNQSYTYLVPGGVPNSNANADGGAGSGSFTVNTFDLWGNMWPQNSYKIQMYVQGTGSPAEYSATYPNDGSWNPTNNANNGGYWYSIAQAGGDQNVSGCMSQACGNPTPVDAEPGQRVTFHYGVIISNLTVITTNTGRLNLNNNSGGFYFVPVTSGGISNVSGASANPGSMSTGSGTYDVSYSARLDYTGVFGFTMRFQNGDVLSCGTYANGANNPTPSSRPYFEVRAGDIATGGGFRSANGSCGGGSDSAYISPLTTGNQISGGIRSFAARNSSRGSVSEFGSDALGLIWGNANGPYGFYSAHGWTLANTNIPSAGMGGYLNSNAQSHCVIDYYDNTRLTATPAGFSGGALPTTSGQYQANSDTVINGSFIPAGAHVTIYVDGDVSINGDITLGKTWDATNPANAPFLAIIAKGDITITSGVTQLDGLYIAQPRSASRGGTFATCDSFCSRQLVVNGAVVAQQIQLLRAHGTMGPLEADINGLTETPAEVFNYVPSMVIGIPNFSALNGGAVIPSGVETLFNLPPVF